MNFRFLIPFLLISRFSFSQTTASKDFVMGRIEVIESVVLKEKRTFNIYLPEGYSLKDTIVYPVVYLLDGSADEDFIHVSGLYQYYAFPWINVVPKSIVVGIATIDRKRDFTFPSDIAEEKQKLPTSGHSDKFIQFIKEELQPFINKNYKTSIDNTLIGQSLGGLFATQVLLEHPELFNRYIIISPSIWWNDGSVLKTPLEKVEKKILPGTMVYIGFGKEGLAPSTIPHVMEIDAHLLEAYLKNFKVAGMKIYLDYLPNENHATIFHQAIMNAFKMVYKQNKD